MKVIALGTSAGRPTLERSSPSMALEYEGDVFLFDCGEGTQSQLTKSKLRWINARAIFIGHLHGDHLNGLPGILGTMALSERSQPLWLFGPSGLKDYIELLKNLKNLWIPFVLHLHEIKNSGIIYQSAKYEIQTEPLKHVVECWGYRFQEKQKRGKFDEQKAEALGIPFGPLRGELAAGKGIEWNGKIFHGADFIGPPQAGKSVAYCSDTAPCEGSLKLSQDADLLIHESTFDHTLIEEIGDWGHSTSVQAAQTAAKANAKKLLLTHISPRYVKDASLLLKQAQEIFLNTELAEDLKEYPI